MKILGWYSLVLLIFSTLCNIGDSKSSGGMRVAIVATVMPIIAYIGLNLFR
ncbi:hypothetical protein [Anaerosalibacter massiliensis]|uniref:hypothetical protein n=1 Tax=Anaerosalibacter massiliensis TaxID=1347392 RepID=UPI00164E40F2|nr:hypothetical protein [Anaerosalibacter massiliensis]